MTLFAVVGFAHFRRTDDGVRHGTPLPVWRGMLCATSVKHQPQKARGVTPPLSVSCASSSSSTIALLLSTLDEQLFHADEAFPLFLLNCTKHEALNYLSRSSTDDLKRLIAVMEDTTPLASLSVTHVYYVSQHMHPMSPKPLLMLIILGPSRQTLPRMRIPRPPPSSPLRRLRHPSPLYARSRGRPHVCGPASLRGHQLCS